MAYSAISTIGQTPQESWLFIIAGPAEIAVSAVVESILQPIEIIRKSLDVQVKFSSSITRTQALKVKSAFEYADGQGKPMCRHITILWSLLAGYQKTGSVERQSRFVRSRTAALLKKMDDFCRYYGIPKCFVYVHENSPHPTKNLEKLIHTHMAVYMPDDLLPRFEPLLIDWVFGSQKYRRDGRTVRMTSHPTGQTIMQYLLKGTDPTATVTVPDQGEISLQEYLKITPDPAKWDQGLFHGKRVGMSKALSKARTSGARSHCPPAPPSNGPELIDLPPALLNKSMPVDLRHVPSNSLEMADA